MLRRLIFSTLLIANLLIICSPKQVLSVDADDWDGAGQTRVSESLSEFNSIANLSTDLRSINGIISTLLPTLIILAGIILLFMLISGGLSMMTSASDPKSADAGKQKITAALTGFFVLFLSYWIIQILEIVLGVTILGA